MTAGRNASYGSYYPSKRDLWIAVVIVVTAVILVAASLDLLDAPMPGIVKYPLVAVCLAMAGLSVWIFFSTGYTLTSDKLIARCGPFSTMVPLDAIEGVSPSRSPVSSPACSLDRLHIRFRGSRFGLLVSPVDKRAFLEALVARCSNLTLEGESVVLREKPSVD